MMKLKKYNDMWIISKIRPQLSFINKLQFVLSSAICPPMSFSKRCYHLVRVEKRSYCCHFDKYSACSLGGFNGEILGKCFTNNAVYRYVILKKRYNLYGELRGG